MYFSKLSYSHSSEKLNYNFNNNYIDNTIGNHVELIAQYSIYRN